MGQRWCKVWRRGQIVPQVWTWLTKWKHMETFPRCPLPRPFYLLSISPFHPPFFPAEWLLIEEGCVSTANNEVINRGRTPRSPPLFFNHSLSLNNSAFHQQLSFSPVVTPQPINPASIPPLTVYRNHNSNWICLMYWILKPNVMNVSALQYVEFICFQ